MDYAVEKLSLTLPAAVMNGLRREAAGRGREVNEHIQKVLAAHVIATGSIDQADATRLRLMFTLVERAVQAAKDLCRVGGFDSAITLNAINACLRDPSWTADYARYVQDDIYKSGNPLKGPINREIGFRIREGIGGTVAQVDGKVVPVKVLGNIIQSYSPMESFDPEAVERRDLEWTDRWLNRPAEA